MVIDAAGRRRDNRTVRGRASIFAAVCVASGCGFQIDFGAAGGDDGGMTRNDGGSPITGDASFGCYGTGLLTVCLRTQPPPSYTVTVPTTLDTNVAGNCTVVDANINGICVVVAETIDITSRLRSIGPRPLVLVATQELSISGRVDVSSHEGDLGAGVSTTVCANGAGPSGLGGGAGGAFGGQGGRGGNDTGGTSGPSSSPPVALRGGCRGQGGGGPFGIGGDGGHGGGSVYLIAGGSISVDGAINASGAGGRGANLSVVAGGGGGGGGGSGGMIVLDAPTVGITGEVFANGGGGGGGANAVENGGSGDDPASADAMPDGGTNAPGAGKGGRGTVGMFVDGGVGETRSVLTTGGGGGGGGAGYTHVYGVATVTGRVSPAL